MEISVVICTRDRPLLLANALESLRRQTLPRSRFEVIVVDNGGGSGIAVAESFGVDHTHCEPVPGLSRARNAGWRLAAGSWVAFFDDDAEAPPGWLDTARELLASRGAPVVGGPILPLYDAQAPPWFKDDYERRSWGPEERLLTPGESLSGSNFFIERRLLAALGGFDERLGMRGDTIAVGEETELFDRLWARGDATVLYSPSLAVSHLVPSSKMTVRYQMRRAASAGEAWATRARATRSRAGIVGRDLLAATVLAGRALVRIRRPLQQWAVEELGPVAGRIGSAWGALR
jgi:glycosyltransferase involved in cell wall biosynthesis